MSDWVQGITWSWERIDINPRLDSDLAEALAVAKDSSCRTSSFLSVAKADWMQEEQHLSHLALCYESLREIRNRRLAVYRVLADLVPVGQSPDLSKWTCAHVAAIEIRDKLLSSARDFHNGDLRPFCEYVVLSGRFDDLPDAQAIRVACEREAYAALEVRQARREPPAGQSGSKVIPPGEQALHNLHIAWRESLHRRTRPLKEKFEKWVNDKNPGVYTGNQVSAFWNRRNNHKSNRN